MEMENSTVAVDDANSPFANNDGNHNIDSNNSNFSEFINHSENAETDKSKEEVDMIQEKPIISTINKISSREFSMEMENSTVAVDDANSPFANIDGNPNTDSNNSNFSEFINHSENAETDKSKEEVDMIQEKPNISTNGKPPRAKIVVPTTNFNPIISPNGIGNIRSRIAGIRKDNVSSRDLEFAAATSARNVGRSASSNRRFEIEQMKIQRRQEEEAQFTYYPKTVTKKKNDPKMEFFEDRFLILYGDAKKCHLTQRTERLRELLEEELTFSPKLSPRVRSVSRGAKGRKDFEQRLHDMSLTASKERMIAARSDSSDIVNPISTKPKGASKSTVDEYTFSPKISSRAKSMDRVRGNHLSDSSALSVNERLYLLSAQLKKKQEKRRAEAEKFLYEECTFTPQIVSSRAVSPRAKVEKPTSPPKGGKARNEYLSTALPERLMKYEKYRTERLLAAVRAREEKELEAATFQPQLIAKHVSVGELIGQPLPVHERLAVPPDRQKLSGIEAAVYADFTFQPQLIATKRMTSPITRTTSPIFPRVRDRSPKPDRQNIAKGSTQVDHSPLTAPSRNLTPEVAEENKRELQLNHSSTVGHPIISPEVAEGNGDVDDSPTAASEESISKIAIEEGEAQLDHLLTEADQNITSEIVDEPEAESDQSSTAATPEIAEDPEAEAQQELDIY